MPAPITTERSTQRRPTSLLSERETEVLRLVREGLTNKQIAARLVISAGTVRSHLEHIFEKLDVHTRTAAVARAFYSSPRHLSSRIPEPGGSGWPQAAVAASAEE